MNEVYGRGIKKLPVACCLIDLHSLYIAFYGRLNTQWWKVTVKVTGLQTYLYSIHSLSRHARHHMWIRMGLEWYTPGDMGYIFRSKLDFRFSLNWFSNEFWTLDNTWIISCGRQVSIMHAKTCRLLLSVKMGAESALIWRRSKAATTLWPATFNIIFDFTPTKWLGYAAGELPRVDNCLTSCLMCEGPVDPIYEFSWVNVGPLECISVFYTPGNLVWRTIRVNFQHWQIYNKFIDLYPFSHTAPLSL